MNDIGISWDRVHSTLPEMERGDNTAGWIREEITKMLVHAGDIQNRAIILVLASSGVRAGALDPLDWGDLTPVYRADCRLTLDPGEGSEVVCAVLDVYQ